jgi:hypothetical protein
MSDIGQEAVHIVGGDRSGILLYAEIGDRWSSSSLFRDEGDVVRYFRTSERMDDLLWKAWYAVRARFGDKPVVYPPFPGTGVELKP